MRNFLKFATLLSLCACARPSELEQAIANFEGIPLKVLEWQEVETVTAGDSAAILRPGLEQAEAYSLKLHENLSFPTKATFANEFRETSFRGEYLHLKAYESAPDSCLGRVVSAKIEVQAPGGGAKPTYVRAYYLDCNKFVVLSRY